MNTLKADKLFKQNLQEVLTNGNVDESPRPYYADDTPAHTKFITQVCETYDYQKGELPCTSLRNIAVKTGIREIQWIYQLQNSSLESAYEVGLKWWDLWDIGDGTIGQRYGATVRKYDIMNKLLKGLETNPFGRRHIIDMWQYEDFETAGLNPCAFMSMYSVRKANDIYYLDATLIQRSSDAPIANHINKTGYLALALMICSHLRHTTHNNWQVGNFTHFVQNYHIYDRHIDAVNELLEREPSTMQQVFELTVDKNFYDIDLSDFNIQINHSGKLNSPLELAI